MIGAFAGVFYTAPPLRYKYRALGEISVFLIWGPLMVEGAYFVQRQALEIAIIENSSKLADYRRQLAKAQNPPPINPLAAEPIIDPKSVE